MTEPEKPAITKSGFELTARPFRLAIGFPAYGGTVAYGHDKMTFHLGAMCRAHNKQCHIGAVITIDVCGVDMARNYIVANAMKANCDWVLMVDADTWCDTGGDLLRMVIEAHSVADQLKMAMIGVPVRRRNGPLNVFGADKDGKPKTMTLEELNAVRAERSVGPFFEVAAIGTAICALNLHRVNEADAQFKFISEKHLESHGTWGEDVDMCYQLRNHGFTVWCDPRPTTHHMKHEPLTYEGLK